MFIAVLSIFIRLLIKLGLAPFHYWYIKLAEKISHAPLFFLRISQKIIPLYIIIILTPIYLKEIIFLNVILRIVGAINEIQIKKIFAFSSIFSVSWLLWTQNFIWRLLFLISYGLGLFCILFISWQNNVKRITRLQLLEKESKILISIAMFNFIGIPPFGIFVFKVKLLYLIINFSFFIASLWIVRTIFFAYIYLRIFLNFTIDFDSQSFLTFNIPQKLVIRIIIFLFSFFSFFFYFCAWQKDYHDKINYALSQKFNKIVAK